ncbi:Wzt carbohydrate-binding domain-containing protein, partial [bacterium]|nr:Wzt carbohydrate-binding domain-containing protein [bacterium]
ELTGRDNVYMNGTILGMTKREIDSKFDGIVDFAGIERFLDTPTKRYSSGMQVRLAFAVAAHLEPEILIIDEVLAVGDAEFQKKCLGKMQAVSESGRTVLFVSHNMAAVESLCTRCLEINEGELVKDGPTRDVVEHYRSHAFEQSANTSGLAFDAAEYFSNVTLIDSNDNPTNYLPLAGKLRIRMEFDVGKPVNNPQIGIGINSITGQRMLTVHTPISHRAISKLLGKHVVECCIPDFPLAPGEYVLQLVLSENREELDILNSVVPFTIANGEAFGEGRGHHRGICVAPSLWSQS